MKTHHPANFSGHRSRGSRDIMILVCQVISQDHIIKGSCDIMARRLSGKVNILASLVAIGTVMEI